MSKLPKFDPTVSNEAFFDAEVTPLLTKIHEMCRARGIAYVSSYQYDADHLCTNALLPDGCGEPIVAASLVLRGECAVVLGMAAPAAEKPVAKA